MDKKQDNGGEYTKLTQDQLDAMVQLHIRFLEGTIGGRRAILRYTDISGLNLKGKDLRQCDFYNCFLKDMNLESVNFKEATLCGCDFSNSRIDQACFIRADLRGCVIENASLENADFENADLRVGNYTTMQNKDVPVARVVNFRGANLTGAKLMGSAASSADFSDASLVGTNMTRADLRNSSFVGADLSGATIIDTKLTGAQLDNALLTDAHIESAHGIDLSGAITDNAERPKVVEMGKTIQDMLQLHRRWLETAGKEGEQLNMTGVDIRMLQTLKKEVLTAAVFTNCLGAKMNMSHIMGQSLKAANSFFRASDFEGADLRGADFKGANLANCNFKDIQASALLLGTSGPDKRFSPCVFDDARLCYSDFSNANLKNASFKNANLTGVNFDGAKLAEADFTGANLQGVQFGEAYMTDAIFDADQRKAFHLPGIEDEEAV